MNRPRDNYQPPYDRDRWRDDRYYRNHNGNTGSDRRSRSPPSHRGRPPLPPGPPPPGPPRPPYDDYQPPPPSEDSHVPYSDHQRSGYGRRPSSPPPYQQQDMFRFRGQATRRPPPLDYDSPSRHSDENAYRSHGRPDGRGTFDFRPPRDAPDAPLFPPESHHRPPHRGRRDDHHDRQARQRPRGPYRGPPAHASERALLRANRERTPEQLTGMNEGVSRFRATGPASESEGEGEGDKIDTADSSNGDPSHHERRTKRVKTAPSAPAEQIEPKWSNVDAYGLIVPADGPVHRPKDLLGIIRRAKVDAQLNVAAAPAPDDFISLSNDADANKSALAPTKSGFSHLDNLHPNRTAPGAPLASRISKGSPTIDRPAAKKTKRGARDDVISISSDDDSTVSVFLEKQTQRPSHRTEPAPSISKKRKFDEVRDRHMLDDITEGWQPRHTEDPTPWLKDHVPDRGDPELWLHREIKMWYDFARPQDFEERVRLRLIDRIQTAVRNVFPHVQIHPFGSFASKLYLPVADMDLVARSRNFIDGRAPSVGQSRSQMNKFADTLTKARIIAPGSRIVIANARVPIIKYKDQTTGIRVDISFENNSGIVANDTLIAWKQRFPAMPWIVMLIKQFLAVRNLHEVHTGGLGGFSIICLVCCSLAKLEREHDPGWDALGHLDEVLLHLFSWFGYDFDMARFALDMKTFEPVPRSAFRGRVRNNVRLLIIDPNNAENDVSGGTSRCQEIFGLFRAAHGALLDRMDDFAANRKPHRPGGGSILACIWAANYDLFREQRARLERIDKSLPAPTSSSRQQSSNPHRTAGDRDPARDVHQGKSVAIGSEQAPSTSPKRKGKDRKKFTGPTPTTEETGIEDRQGGEQASRPAPPSTAPDGNGRKTRSGRLVPVLPRIRKRTRTDADTETSGSVTVTLPHSPESEPEPEPGTTAVVTDKGSPGEGEQEANLGGESSCVWEKATPRVEEIQLARFERIRSTSQLAVVDY